MNTEISLLTLPICYGAVYKAIFPINNRVLKPVWPVPKAIFFDFLGLLNTAPIETILEAPCPFWEGKQVKDTHLLVLIPSHVAGNPLTLEYLGELIQSPQGGHRTKYDWGSDHLAQTDTDTRSQSPGSSYWVLITKAVLPGSCKKSYQEQCALVEGCKIRTGLAYKVPTALEATVVMALHHVSSGTALGPYTRCWDENHNDTDYHLAVGSDPFGGVDSSNYTSLNSSNLSSMGYFRNLQSSAELASSVGDPDHDARILLHKVHRNHQDASLGALAARPLAKQA